MNAQTFIESKLNYLFSKYADIQIRYEFRANTQSHIIEIIPLSFFKTNIDYLNDEAQFEKEFETLYPQENIVFISVGSLVEIKNPILELGQPLILDCPVSVSEVEVSCYGKALELYDYENYALAA